MEDKQIDIIALKFPDNVRTRLGMYLGSNEDPSVGLREVIDNSIDELMGSTVGTKIDIQLKQGQQGGWYVVADNGRGIPIIWDSDYECTKTELAMTTINAGSKFDGNKSGVSVGTNGTGASAFVAVCNRYLVLSKVTDQNYDKSISSVKDFYTTHKGEDEIFYILYFEKGIKIAEGCNFKSQIESDYGFHFPPKMSTITAFVPDDTIWLSTVATYSKKALQYVSVILDKFYNKTAEIIIDGNAVADKFEPFKFEFTRQINLPGINSDIPRTAEFYVSFEVDKDMSVFDATGSINSLIVNRGLHIDCTRKAYSEALKGYFKIYHDHLTPGLRFNVICLSPIVDYSSQTKERCTKINNLWTEDLVPILAQEFRQIFRDNEQYFAEHVARLNEYADSLTKISAINMVKQVVGTVDGGNRTRSKLPSSVKDAASNDRLKCELFITEGKSAASTMLKARDPRFHAILPLRGVPLNAINADLDTIMDNEEMRGLITAIGAGVNEYFKLESARYGKIILAGDADADGCKINSMLLGTIAKKMTFLLDDGRVFIAVGPLYVQGNVKVYPGESPNGVIDFSKPFTRVKGWGEASVPQAREWFFNNDTRRLIQVTSHNLEYVFDLLSQSSTRKQLMINNGIIIDKYNTDIL